MRARVVLAGLLVVAGCGCGNGVQTTPTTPDAVEVPVRDAHEAPARDAAEPVRDAAPAPDAVATPTVILGDPPARVRVQLARTAAERSRGLMYVQNLPLDDGMLFIFPRDDDHNFWMKNTLIPLDMIFIRADLTIAGVVANAVPLSEEPRGVGQPSRYVLEVNGGWAEAHGVTPDSKVTFEGIFL